MPTLETVQQYIDECRVLLQDKNAPFRYSDVEIITGLNIGLMEARRLRADLFLPAFVLPEATIGALTAPIAFDPMYRSALIYYVVGRMQLRDDEPTVDGRAAAMLTKFTQQLLMINS